MNEDDLKSFIRSWADNVAELSKHNRVAEAINVTGSLKPIHKLLLAYGALMGNFYKHEGDSTRPRYPLRGQRIDVFPIWLKWVISDLPSSRQWWYWAQNETDQELIQQLRDLILDERQKHSNRQHRTKTKSLSKPDIQEILGFVEHLHGQPISGSEAVEKQLEELTFEAGHDRESLSEKDIEDVRAFISELRKQPLFSRDEYVMAIVKSMRDDEVNSSYRKSADKDLTHWSYFEDYFFNWFLRRNNIANAREVFGDANWAPSLHYVVFLVSSVVVWAYFQLIPLATFLGETFWILVAILLFIVHSFMARSSGIGLHYHYQTFIPRLGATTGVGFLSIMSISDLKKLLLTDLGSVAPWIIAMMFLIGMGILIYLNIKKQVKPPPRKSSIVRRTFDILTIGLMYSQIGLFVFAGLLFDEFVPFGGLFLTSVVALAIGFMLQLIWEDKPITEPL